MATVGYNRRPPANPQPPAPPAAAKKKSRWEKTKTAAGLVALPFVLAWRGKKLIPLAFIGYQALGAAYLTDNFSDAASYMVFDSWYKAKAAGGWLTNKSGNAWGWANDLPAKDRKATPKPTYIQICSPTYYPQYATPPAGMSREGHQQLINDFAVAAHEKTLDTVSGGKNGRLLSLVNAGLYPVVFEPAYGDNLTDIRIEGFESKEKQKCGTVAYHDGGRVMLPR